MAPAAAQPRMQLTLGVFPIPSARQRGFFPDLGPTTLGRQGDGMPRRGISITSWTPGTGSRLEERNAARPLRDGALDPRLPGT